MLRNGEKYIAALSGADYCLSGDDNGAGAVSAIREAEEAHSDVFRNQKISGGTDK